MAEFYSFSNHEVLEALRDSRVLLKEPFSTSHLKTPVVAVIEALGVVHTHLIHDRENTGVTDEELDVIRSLERKMKGMHEADVALRRKQDLILRCLHPDGCFRSYLSKEVILEAYGIIPVDPVEGICGISLGWSSDKLDELHTFLTEKVERLHMKHMRW